MITCLCIVLLISLIGSTSSILFFHQAKEALTTVVAIYGTFYGVVMLWSLETDDRLPWNSEASARVLPS